MTWFTFSLLSIIALASAELLQQYLLNADNHFDERTSAVLTFLVQAVFTIPFIVFTDLRYTFFDIFKPHILPKFIGVAIIASFGMIYYLKSFKVKNISISTIFVSLSIVISTSLGIILLNEGLYFYKILGIFLVLGAIVAINIKNINIEKNHYYGLIAGLLFGTTYTLDKLIVLNIHPINYIFWSFTSVAFFGFIISSKKVIHAIQKTKRNEYKPIVYSGIAYFIYNYATFTAYTLGGEVGRIDAINNSQIFLIILVEYFILNQKQGLIRKIITAIIAFSGILILGYL